MNTTQNYQISSDTEIISKNGFSRNLAFIIGINNYKNGISPLKTAVNDAKKIVETLREKHGYQVWVYLDEVAILSKLNQFIEKTLPEQVTENDRLLFYFAGHGVALNGDDCPAGYLIPQDAKQGDINSYLPMTRLHDALNKLPCRHFLGILDCCFGGAFRWSSTRDLLTSPELIHKERYDRFIADPAWQIITSSASDQKAFDNFKLDTERGQIGNHSPFAAALLEALEGEADAYPPAKNGKPAGDGVITATELYLYLRDRVEIPTEKHRLRQTPGIWCLNKHDKGEYIFLSPGHELNLPPAPPLDESQNPYRGLKSFEEEHSSLFFGRSKLVEKLEYYVKANPLTVVLGASGSGKSSLVKAGLIPKLKKEAKETNEKWCTLSPIRPGETPFQALNNALVDVKLSKIELQNKQKTLAQSVDSWVKNNPNSKLLIFIDQTEELITLCKDENQRKEFFQQIFIAVKTLKDKLRVVLSLGSDFEPQIRDAGLKSVIEEVNLGNTELKNLWQTGRFIVPAMTRRELREAIEKPAEARVMFFQPYDLVEKLIDEVDNMPGGLPLLSFALSELYLKYLHRQRVAQYKGITIDRALTAQDYQELGGVMRSLTQRADGEYLALVKENPAYEQVIRHVILRMVAIGGGELARRRVPLSELEYPSEKNILVKEVIERFTKARLLVEGQDAEGKPYVEPAHDALVRGWQKLLEWKQEEEEGLILQRRLTPAAEEWKIQQQPRFLWNANPRLDLLKKELNSDGNWLNKVETEFVQRSIRKRRRNTRVRWSLAGSVILGSVIFSAAIWLQLQQTELRAKAARAEVLLSTDPVNALVLAIQATGQNISLSKLLPFEKILLPVQSSILNVVQEAREANRFSSENNSHVESLAVSPDSQYIASGHDDGILRLWDRQGKLINKTQVIYERRVNFVAFVSMPDGQYIVSFDEDDMVRLWDFKGKPHNSIRPFKIPNNSVIALSKNGKYIVSGHQDGTLQRWDLNGNRISQPFPMHESEHEFDSKVLSIAVSHNGRYIVSSSRESVQLWDLNTNSKKEIFKEAKVEGYPLVTLSLSTNDDYIVGGQANPQTDDVSGGMRLWYIDKEIESTTFQVHTRAISKVQVSANSEYILSGVMDGTIKVVNKFGNLITQFQNSGGSIALSPDNSYVVGNSGGEIRIFDLKGTLIGDREFKYPEFQNIPTFYKTVSSPDDKYIISNSKALNLRDRKGQILLSFKEKTVHGVYFVNFTPDGNYIVTGSYNGKVEFWNREGKRIRQFSIGESHIIGLSSQTQSIITVTRNNNMLQLWDQFGNSFGKEFKIGEYDRITLSPNGKIIVTSKDIDSKGEDSQLLSLWDLKGKRIGKPIQIDHKVTSIALSPDGNKIITGIGLSNEIRLWDLTGKQIGNTFRGHPDNIHSVAFSPNGEYTVSQSVCNTDECPLESSTRPTLWLLDLEGNPIGNFLHIGYATDNIPVTSDSKYILTYSGVLYPANWEGGLEVACNRLRYHPVLQKPKTDEAKAAKETCQKYIW